MNLRFWLVLCPQIKQLIKDFRDFSWISKMINSHILIKIKLLITI